MIVSFKHKGLQSFWEKGDARRIIPNWISKTDRILNALDQAQAPEDLDFPGWRLHPLKGEFSGYYAVDVSGNWRITFRFEGSHVAEVDLIDYH